MELSERLRYYRKSIGLTQEDFANKLGIKQGSYSDIERGKVKKLSDSVFALLKMVYNLNPNWVLRGEGEMIIGTRPEEAPPDRLTYLMDKEAKLIAKIEMQRERIEELQHENRELLQQKAVQDYIINEIRKDDDILRIKKQSS